MAGIGRPVSVGKIIKGIKSNHPNVLVQYHGHSTPGFSIVSSLEAARAGADIIDVGMEPLSWGTGHADLLAVREMLDDAGFDVPEVNMKAYMQARALSKEFMDDYLGLYISPNNRKMNSLLIGPTKKGKPEITRDDLLVKLFEEVQYAWPQMGYPPLVTPFSQYVKNVSLRNALNLIKGRERWDIIDENTWGMLLGKSGKLPGQLGDDIQAIANEQNKEFFYGNPQDLFPDELELFAQKMDEKGWAYGEDDEELLEYAMHPSQYEDFKSGKAKENFNADVAKRRAAAGKIPAAAVPMAAMNGQPKTLNIDVNGETFKVKVSYGDDVGSAAPVGTAAASANGAPAAISNGSADLSEILAPLEGKFLLTKDNSESPVKVGDLIKQGDVIGYIESMKVYNAITADKGGTVVEISATSGEDIEEEDVILRLQE